MKSPIRELRLRRGWTKQQLAKALKTSTRRVTEIEEGQRRISLKFKSGFEQMGVNFWELSESQENFLLWRKRFHFALAQGLNPDHYSFEASFQV